jgi:predicted transcriptional regulator of viral defense system
LTFTSTNGIRPKDVYHWWLINVELNKALTLSLGSLDDPVITSYQLGKVLLTLYIDKKFRGEDLSKLQKDFPDFRDFERSVSKLLDEGVLSTYRGLPNTVYTILGRSKVNEEDVACTVDPFCYLSHLSAMDYHGLTNRIPSKIFLSSPSTKMWKESALKKMQGDLKEQLTTYIESGLPTLKRVQFQKLASKQVHIHNSLHLGAYKNVRGRQLRVSTIGRTFLDMLRTPNLCGGMTHVLDIFAEFGEKYLRLITDEIDSHGKPIDKVRAGYIFEERLNVKSDTIKSWENLIQRGGSRKLDPSEEYIPEWSEKWCISLNIFENV